MGSKATELVSIHCQSEDTGCCLVLPFMEFKRSKCSVIRGLTESNSVLIDELGPSFFSTVHVPSHSVHDFNHMHTHPILYIHKMLHWGLLLKVHLKTQFCPSVCARP